MSSNPKDAGMLAFVGFFVSIFVHWNARMMSKARSAGEFMLAFADNSQVYLWSSFYLLQFIGRQETMK